MIKNKFTSKNISSVPVIAIFLFLSSLTSRAQAMEKVLFCKGEIDSASATVLFSEDHSTALLSLARDNYFDLTCRPLSNKLLSCLEETKGEYRVDLREDLNQVEISKKQSDSYHVVSKFTCSAS